ncbi:MAG TPA: CsiV family protein [Pseudomonadales bacterium]|nr:CsiV family protein [Pseudomonadales bacterium]HND13342.1 CsiV family protein [Pseudomonadales bacterium]
MIARRVLTLLGALLLATLAAAAGAQSPAPAPDITPSAPAGNTTVALPAWIQIEVVVFRELDTSSAGNERWPDDPTLSYPEPLRRLDDPATATQPGPQPADPSAGSEPVAFRQLDAPRQVLADAAARIAASAQYRLLAHLAWRQQAADGSTTHLLATGGATYGEHHELEGSLTVTNADVPEVTLRLWLNDFATAATGETAVRTGVALPTIPQATPFKEPSAEEATPLPAEPQQEPEPKLEPEPEREPEQGITVEPVRAARSVLLQATRRLVPGQLHYIDHPLFGVLITAVPFDPAAPTATPAEPSVSAGDAQ